MASQLTLTKGHIAIVDDDVYEWACKMKWYYNLGYAASKPRSGIVYLHRLIMNSPKDLQIDHINGNRLDNRKENLRVCTKSQNAMNSKLARTNTSGYKGVNWDKRYNKWRARIKLNKKEKHLGFFNNKEDAAKAYNEAAIKYFGEFARIN